MRNQKYEYGLKIRNGTMSWGGYLRNGDGTPTIFLTKKQAEEKKQELSPVENFLIVRRPVDGWEETNE